MQLTVLERLLVLNALPKEGSMLELVSARNIRKAVEFGEDELVKINFEQKEGQITWDAQAADGLTKDADFTGPQTKLIVDVLTKLDSGKKLTPDHLSLCEKFGIGKD